MNDRATISIVLTLAMLTACGANTDTDREAARLGDADAGIELPTITTPVIPDDAPTVVFLGDSIAAGLHLPAEYAFPAAAQRLLAAEGHPFRLVNAGVSGDTTRGGLERLAWVLRTEPDVVVIELGGNDGLRGVELESTESNLRALVEGVRATGATPLLLGVRVPSNLGDYATRFAALYPRLAQELEVPFVDFFMDGVGGVPEMNLEDQLHPTPKGHERLAQNIAPALAEVLPAPAGVLK